MSNQQICVGNNHANILNHSTSHQEVACEEDTTTPLNPTKSSEITPEPCKVDDGHSEPTDPKSQLPS